MITFNQCRDARCSACFMLNSTVEILIISLDNDGLNYVENFITVFLRINDITIKKFFGVEKNMKPKKEKRIFGIIVYHKSEKNRSQVMIKTFEVYNKIQYISKRRKHTFYKNI